MRTWQSQDACTLSRHCEPCKQSSWSRARNSQENRAFLTASGGAPEVPSLIQLHAHTYIHSHTRTHIHSHTRTHIHSHTHTYTPTHAHTLERDLVDVFLEQEAMVEL